LETIYGKDFNEFKNYLLMTPKDIIEKISNALAHHNPPHWITQLISNKDHSIDVDKLDYLRRDVYHLNFEGYSFASE